jgi:hypothetical protein
VTLQVFACDAKDPRIHLPAVFVPNVSSAFVFEKLETRVDMVQERLFVWPFRDAVLCRQLFTLSTIRLLLIHFRVAEKSLFAMSQFVH